MEYLSQLANYILQNAIGRSPAFKHAQGLANAVQMFLQGVSK